MSAWRDAVRRELRTYVDDTGHDIVERQTLLDQALPRLRRQFPDANTPDQTLSRVLQELRDRGELTFLDDGVYRIEPSDDDAQIQFTNLNDEPVVNRESASAYTAREYVTTVGARSLSSAFRELILDKYGSQCPISGVDYDGLLDVAHVLPWSEYPKLRSEPGNVVLLDKTHHAAFDCELFTIDGDLRIRTAPTFETESDHLRRTLLDRNGERIDLPAEATLDTNVLERRNESVPWY